MIRFCKDIGMFCLDFPILTCIFRTIYCNANCYNRKIYAMHDTENRMTQRDIKNFEWWQNCTAQEFVDLLLRKRHQINRFRWATRGEACYSKESILKIREIALLLPNTLFWLPTRAWRSPEMREFIEKNLMALPNMRVMASLDPSTPRDSVPRYWNTLYFGDNSDTNDRVLCTKTWEHKKNVCPTCEQGCFTREIVHVHLKKH